MGKRKDMIHPRFLCEGGSSLHSVHKRKHKKHKKHKKKHHSFTEAPEPVVVPRPPPQLRLKIKLGGQTLGTKSVPTFTVHPGVACPPSPLMIINNVDDDDDDDDNDDDDDDDDEDDEDDDEPSVPLEQYRAWLDEDSNLAVSPMPDIDSDSMLGVPVDEEERWLDALEKGELDDNGELKKEVDESLLTARQKALLHKQQSQPLLELPMGYKEKEMTAEMMQKREERARKRRLQAAKKAEENKNQTIERLTKTSKAKIKSMRERKSKQNQCPMVRYSDCAQGMAISFPIGVPAPVPTPPCPPPAAPVNCGASGCSNLKKYSCSKTRVPLCSLECYKRNLLLKL
ncbi:INO80 complex subunit B isoform X1 [Etheostoma cragini]|uniref:INO80 complex subunit B isoform X1 n=1 Tax=Etheostoma cragini TaxID=417921 RepID=UPI00155DF3FF|nr:INO80 complex subunit B isoform X1 [Etheostoma cragini]XP_034712241.1 INO80 complex subunit B isoform X1 [Etheostoma cragini]XP_034712242.1 INO80 complex subunit B isoform X1 [Etheostoma cragini]